MKLRNLKKLSLALVFGLILSVFAPLGASAAENDGKITLDSPTKGETYELYKVFDLSYQQLDPADDTTKAYTYTPSSDTIRDLILGNDDYKDLLIEKGTSYIVDTNFLNEINIYDFSNWLYKNSNSLVNMNDPRIAESNADIVWDKLELGYYMIKSSAGTIVSLTSTDKTPTVKEKNPTGALLKFEKGVKVENDDGDFKESTYANIGENLNFELTFTVPEIHQHLDHDYVLTDTLDSGLTYNNNLNIAGIEGYESKVEGQTLTVTFPAATINELAKEEEENRKITITYDAKLNNNALLSNHDGIKANSNTATLQYDQVVQNGENSALVDKTVTGTANVYTTEFNIYKYTGENTALAGAKFKIYTEETEGTPLNFYADGTDYYFSPTDGEGTVNEITTNDTGTFSIKGLKKGTYFIEESQAPSGYNPLPARVQLDIEEGTEEPKVIKYNTDVTDVASVDNTVKIKNNTGTRLPDTGGMGRTLIYTIGGIVFFVALVGLVSRNKNKEKQA